MPHPGSPHSQRFPHPQHQHAQHQHAQHQHAQHQPFSAAEARALVLDLAGGAAAATLMLVLTCWLLSLGGAFAPGHAQPAGAHQAAAHH